MNAERLHVIALKIREDLQKTSLESILQGLLNHLQNQVNQPNQAAHQQQVSQTLTNLYSALENAPSNNFPPTWWQTIKEVGGEGLLGIELRSNIEEIFARNQITPSLALQEVREIHSRLVRLRDGVEHLITAFEKLNIGTNELQPGECELGVLIPRSFVKNRLDNFSKELSELNQIFNTFAEVATGSRPGFEIRSLSTSELSVLLDLAPVIGACLAHAIERIVSLYKQLLEIRKLHNELKEKGVPAQGLKGVEEHANSLMDEGIEKLIPELIAAFYKKRDKGRENELITELRLSLKKIAGRIDRGYNIEIRVEPAEVADEEKAEGKQGETTKHIEAIKSAAKTLQYIKEGGEPILRLPDGKQEKPGKTEKE